MSTVNPILSLRLSKGVFEVGGGNLSSFCPSTCGKNTVTHARCNGFFIHDLLIIVLFYLLNLPVKKDCGKIQEIRVSGDYFIVLFQ